MPKRMAGTKANDNSMYEFKNPLLSGKPKEEEPEGIEGAAQKFLQGQNKVGEKFHKDLRFLKKS